MSRLDLNRARRLVHRIRDGARTAPAGVPGVTPPHRAPSVAESAQLSGWPTDEATDSLVTALDDLLLAARRPPRVAVINAPGAATVGEVISRHRPRARVLELGQDDDPAAMHTALTAAGPFDVIIDDTRTAAGCADRFMRTFMHLRTSGSYLVSNLGDAAVAVTSLDAAMEETFLLLVARLLELKATGGETMRTHTPGLERALASAIARLEVADSHAVVWSRRRVLAKLNEAETNEMLRLRGPATGALLVQLPATRFPTRCTLVESSPQPEGGSNRGVHHQVFGVPPMSLREYSNAVCAPGQLVSVGNILVADNYRKHGGLLNNRYTREFSPWFAVTKEPMAPQRTLAGTYFHLDSEFRGHFGHAMTEQLSRLWALAHARKAYPDLKVLMGSIPNGTDIATFERLLWGAAGIETEDLVIIDEPVRVERLLAATPMFEQPAYVHPDIDQVWSAVGARLADAAPDRDYPRRFFCARRGRHRACRNAPDVERLFAEHGFDIVFPEDYSLSEQARMFRDAEVIGGYAGSALFNICLTQSPKRVFMISSDSYNAKNEYLMAAAMGHHLDIVWCRSKHPMPPDAWVRRAFRSPFTLDFEREGCFLSERLRDLGPL
ncbi:MAG: glycosyltransferase 61 family protein [Marmoricola sp.]